MSSNDVPECLRHRPFDERRKLPVPFMNVIDDDRWDFTTITGPQVDRCIDERLCSVCGKPLNYWFAFIGNEKSGANRRFTDPPMHEECALASLRLCPIMQHGNMARAKAPRVKPQDGEKVILPGSSRVRPVAWFMPITQRFTVESFDGYPSFISGPYKRVRAWRNISDGPGLTELETVEVDRLLREHAWRSSYG
jgi:hypothetical protein